MFKPIAKSIGRTLLGPYRLLRIYHVDLRTPVTDDLSQHDLRTIKGSQQMLLAEDPTIRDHAYFADGKVYAYGLWCDAQLACSCVIWDAERAADAALGDLANTDAVLVDIVTAATHRKRRFAFATIRYAMAQVSRMGYLGLVCTIWHNNHASLRAFENAGWRCTAFVVEVNPFGRKLTFRLQRHWPLLSIHFGRTPKNAGKPKAKVG